MAGDIRARKMCHKVDNTGTWKRKGEKALCVFHKGKVPSLWSRGRSLVQPRC